MFKLFQNAEIFAPEPRGRADVLIADGRIARIGEVDPRALDALGVEHEIVDLRGALLLPGLIDPHQHLLGGSGEEGFAAQTPEFFLSEIIRAGITTVVGCLGVDTTMKTMAGLLAKAKSLRENGLNAYIWTGGYNVPPTSIMNTVREDIMFLEEVIGAGEVAISDLRSMDPPPDQIARVATDCYIGGMLAHKAGLTHFHVGSGPRRLQPLREVLERFDVAPDWLYVTHIERSEELMREAIELARHGAAVDIDTVEHDLPRWLRYYLDNGGDPERLTVSTDAGLNSPDALIEQLRACVIDHGFPLERVLPLVTRNTASILKLRDRGVVEVGRLADLLVLERGSLELVHVLAGGRWMVRDGALCVRESFLEDSHREIHMIGAKAPGAVSR